MKQILDFVPLILFFYFAKTSNILQATQVLLVSSLVVFGVLYVVQQFKLEKQQWITLVLTVVFCSLTLIFHDDIYLRWKSPIINMIFSLSFMLSPYVGRLLKRGDIPLARRMLSQFLSLSDVQWRVLNWVWAGFFLLMAGLHLLFAFVITAYWIDFKVFGSTLLTLLFMVAQVVLLKSHLKVGEDIRKNAD